MEPLKNINLSMLLAAVLAVSSSGCGTKSIKRGATQGQAVQEARQARIVQRARPAVRKKDKPVKPPEGPDLSGDAVVIGRIGSLRSMAGWLCGIVKAAVGRSISLDRMTSALQKRLFRPLIISGLERGIDPAKPVLGAVLAEIGLDLQNMLHRKIPTKGIMVVGVKGTGQKLLAAMASKAQEQITTAWGGYAFRCCGGTRTIWVHIRKGYALFAEDEDHVGSGWKLLDPVMKKALAEPDTLRVDLNWKMLRAPIQNVERMLRPVSHMSGRMRSMFRLTQALSALITQSSGMGLSLSLDRHKGATAEIGLRDLTGWFSGLARQMSPPDTSLLRRLPQNGFYGSLSRVGSYWKDLRLSLAEAIYGFIQAVFFSKIPASSMDTLEEIKDGLSKMIGASEGLAASTAFFHKDRTFHFCRIAELGNTAGFRNGLAAAVKALAKNPKALGDLLLAIGIGRRSLAAASARKGMKIRLSKIRLGGRAADMVRIDLPKSKTKVVAVRLLLGDYLQIVSVYLGRRAFICAGPHARTLIPQMIRTARGKQATTSLAGTLGALQRKIEQRASVKSKTSSGAALALAGFLENIVHLAKTRRKKRTPVWRPQWSHKGVVTSTLQGDNSTLSARIELDGKQAVELVRAILSLVPKKSSTPAKRP